MTWLRKWPNYNNQGLNNSGRIMLWLWRVVFLVPLAQTTKTNVIDNFASRPRLYILQTMFILVASKPVFNNLGWYIFFLSCLFLFMDFKDQDDITLVSRFGVSMIFIFFWKEINTFIQQGCIELIKTCYKKCYFKIITIIIIIINKCSSFELSIH